MFNVDVKNKRKHTLTPDGFEVVPLLDEQHELDENRKLNEDRDFDINSGAELLIFHLFDLPYRLKNV